MTHLISSRNVDVIQVPSKDNNHHAVCTVSLSTSSGQSVSAIGEAYTDADILGTLQLAEQNGYAKAYAILQNLDTSNCGHTTSYNQYPSSQKYNHPSPQAGGGDKPASDKQLNLLHSLCEKRHLDTDTYISKKFNTNLTKLNGSQANQAIRELKQT